MKKQLIVGMIVLIIGVGLSGCNEISDKKNMAGGTTEYNIGESVTVGNIKYTFLSTYWEESYDIYWYKLEIKGENIGYEQESSRITVTKYEMENGYKYNPTLGYEYVYFSINPGRSETGIISCSDSQLSSGIDRDFLPVAKIYLEIGDFIPQEGDTSIILNV